MAVSRAAIIDANFTRAISALSATAVPADLDAPLRSGYRLTGRKALELFESMLSSRHLDLTARELKARGEGFYTIGASGHECNAAVAAATRPTDPAFLHYRAGAFFV